MPNGKFIANNLLNQKLELFVGFENEWLSYADGDVQAYTLLIATPTAYDVESGVITFVNDQGQEFYMDETKIQMFWKAETKFKLIENATSTMRSGKQWLKDKKNMDIM